MALEPDWRHGYAPCLEGRRKAPEFLDRKPLLITCLKWILRPWRSVVITNKLFTMKFCTYSMLKTVSGIVDDHVENLTFGRQGRCDDAGC